jgi:hypothetical protein
MARQHLDDNIHLENNEEPKATKLIRLAQPPRAYSEVEEAAAAVENGSYVTQNADGANGMNT